MESFYESPEYKLYLTALSILTEKYPGAEKEALPGLIRCRGCRHLRQIEGVTSSGRFLGTCTEVISGHTGDCDPTPILVDADWFCADWEEKT